MTQLKIDSIKRYSTDKNGNPLVAKNGNPYEKINIQSNGEWYSCLDFDGVTKPWQDGQAVEVDIEVKGDYKNIVLPKEQGGSITKMMQLLDGLAKMKRVVMDHEDRLAALEDGRPSDRPGDIDSIDELSKETLPWE